MLGAIALLLICQMAGEAVHRFAGVPVPGSVIGMALLLVWLALVRRERPSLEKVTAWLTAHLAIMFVPAAVGLMNEGPVLARHGVAIIVATVISTLLTLVVTARVFQWAVRRMEHKDRKHDGA